MLSAMDQARLTNAQQGVINYATDLVGKATTAEERASAHALAESVRNSAGYYTDSQGNYAGEIKSSSDNLDSILNQALEASQANTAKAQELAESQWKFNANEAKKNRDWQEYMSNTSLQRMVADAKEAGINPIFLAGNGGASTPSGATASGQSVQPDTSGPSLLSSYLTSLINSATAINQANISSKTNLALADINGQYSKYITAMNIGSAMNLQNSANAFSEKMKQYYPDNMYGVFSSLINGIAGAYGIDIFDNESWQKYFEGKNDKKHPVEDFIKKYIID